MEEKTKTEIVWPHWIESEKAKTHRANRAATWRVVRKTVKWTLITAGVVAIAGAVLNHDKPEDESIV